MKLLAPVLFAACCAFLGAAPGTSAGPAATVQQLFDAMSSHDVEAARKLFTPEAALLAVKADGTAAVVPHDQWLEHLQQSKDTWLERMWNLKVLEHGAIATVWAEYDFHLNGKFTHCGVDSVSLLKSSGNWKITGIAFTRETNGCAPSPLGPPPVKP